MSPDEIERMIEEIISSKKYRALDIPQETVRDLLERALKRHKKEADAIRSVRSKLHNIMAPYLEDLDYEAAGRMLDDALTSGEQERIKEVCTQLLRAHHSSAERLAYAKDFYASIFKHVDETCTIVDLACGMNPFILPLIDLPDGLAYYAYDIHTPRVGLIERLFSGGIGLRGNAEVRDILVRPPTQSASAAFIFKEVHRMEKRRSGATRDLIISLDAAHIFISLPTRSLNGRFDLTQRMDALVETSIQGLGIQYDTQVFEGEILYHLEKGAHGKA